MPPEPRTPSRRRLRLPRPGRHWIPQLTAAGAGLLLVPAFPPVGYWWLAPICVALFTLSTRSAADQRAARGKRRPATAAAWTGLWFGGCFCIYMFHWVTVVGTDAWIILGIAEALYFVPLGVATAAVTRLRCAPLWQAALWVADEAARDRWPLNGFPWGRLAFSQSHTPLTPLAALGGAPLVTFATALVGTALAGLAWSVASLLRRQGATPDASDVPTVPSVPKPRGRRVLIPAALWIVLAVALPVAGIVVPLQTTAGKPVELAAIQGNVPRTGLDAYGQAAAVLDNHLAVTEQYAAKVDAGKAPQPAAVIWPEDSDDVDPLSDPAVAAALTQAAQAVHTQILVGTVVADGATQARNEAIVWDPTTGPGAVYVKRHLVPFGEYIPWRSFLTKYFSELSLVPRDFVPGDKPGILTVGGVRIADVICFEVADDGVVRQAVQGNGGVIVVQTNNATYGWTGQPEQQLAISQLRAVEHGRPVLIAATSGISGYITPDGNVHQETRQFTPAVVAALVTPRTGLTLADRVGVWPEAVLAAAGLIAWALGAWAGRRARHVHTSDESDQVEGNADSLTVPSKPQAPVGAEPDSVGGEGGEAAADPADQPLPARKAHT